MSERAAPVGVAGVGGDGAETTVIVPARDAAGTLDACLAALKEQDVPGRGAALIVVDDGSTDVTAAIAAQWGARVLTGPGHGPAGARNTGTHATTSDVVVFLDADTVPEPGWLAAMTAPLRDQSVVAVKGRYRTRQRSPVARFTQLEFEWKYERLARSTRSDYIDTGTAAIRRAALLEAGGFDETLRASEDVDLGYRLAARGGRIVFNPKAVVLHVHTESLPQYFAKKVRAGHTRMLVYGRHPSKARGDAYTPPLMGVQIVLTGITVALAALSLTRVSRLFPAAAAGSLTAFVATTLPVMRHAVRLDPAIAPLVPPLSFLRALAQGLGMTMAVLQLGRRRLTARGDRSA